MIKLTANERVDERPFTHPAYTTLERRLIRYMLTRLCQVLETIHWRGNPNVLAPVVQELIEADGRHHRIIPIRPKLLRERNSFSVVGFFGQRDFDADDTGIAARDKMLFDEMGKHEGLLSYSSLELTNGNYGNCVVFSDDAAKAHWGHSQNHQIAAQDLSPLYYRTIRLYNGILPASIMEAYKLELRVAKYYDYRGTATWAAIRPLVPEER